MEEKCNNCKFWFEIISEPGINTGQCKRYPTFVEKEPYEYCGEFIPLSGSKYLRE
jgi:hypothetical protein